MSADGATVTFYTDVFKSLAGTLHRWRAADGRDDVVSQKRDAGPVIVAARPSALSGSGSYLAFEEYGVGALVSEPLGLGAAGPGGCAGWRTGPGEPITQPPGWVPEPHW